MKKILIVLAVTLAMALCSIPAMAWGSATHGYIEEHINDKGPLLALNQFYGGMAMDVFTVMDSPYAAWMSAAVHCSGFNKMWQLALSPTSKAQAYGFISHNQKWGADLFAHNYSCPDYSEPTEGYIQIKAEMLYSMLPEDIQNLPNAMEMVRSLVEYAVDILLINQDRLIGQKMILATLLRSQEFPLLLNGTYARALSRNSPLNYFEATQFISTAELEFRKILIIYGSILANGKINALIQLPDQLALMAQQLYGVQIDASVIRTALVIAMYLCHGDYMDAINKTIRKVRIRMQSHGFSY